MVAIIKCREHEDEYLEFLEQCIDPDGMTGKGRSHATELERVMSGLPERRLFCWEPGGGARRAVLQLLE